VALDVQYADTLETIAEVAIGVAGFASLVLVLTRDSAARISEQDSMRTRILLVFSLSPVLLAFLPITLAAAGLESPTLWRLASTVMLLAASITWYRTYRSISHLVRLAGGASAMPDSETAGAALFLPTLAVLAIVQLLSQAANCLAIPSPPGPFLYMVGLLAYLTVAILQFARLVFLRLRSS
jgi:hypothetical protein